MLDYDKAAFPDIVQSFLSFREKGGSAITSSEMRHAVRMKGDSTVHFVGGAEI